MVAPMAIGVPFTPSIHRRIEFKNVNVGDMTPCTMLENKLVFSPIQKANDQKRANLSVINEEAVDISKELDGYQLELENSMNEAKATKKKGNHNLMDNKLKKTFSERMNAVVDIELTPTVKSANDETPKLIDMPKMCDDHSCHESSANHSECPKSSTPKTPNENCIAKYSMDESMNEVPDVVYEEVNDSQNERDETDDNGDDDDRADTSCDTEFEAPARFVRNYRRDIGQKPIDTIAPKKSDSNCTNEKKSEQKSKDSNEMLVGIRRSIRKSIRNWMQPSTNAEKKEKVEKLGSLGSNQAPSHFLSTIRHSLRRKQPKKPLATSTPCASLNDISIIADIAKPRAVFKDVNVVAMNVVAKDLSRNKLRSSLRKSSRNVMRTVFKKKIEDFDL